MDVAPAKVSTVKVHSFGLTDTFQAHEESSRESRVTKTYPGVFVLANQIL